MNHVHYYEYYEEVYDELYGEWYSIAECVECGEVDEVL